MFGFAWLALGQAQEALKSGRLEEAYRLLGQPAAQGHKRSWDLFHQLARAYVERGERHLRQDDPEAAWQDLLQAEQIQSAECEAERLRSALVRLGLSQVRALLQVGEPGRAGEVVAQLGERSVRHSDLKWLDEATRGWSVARELVERGEYTTALGHLERVRQLLPESDALAQFHDDALRRQRMVGSLLIQLHEAVETARWREVLELSEQVLKAAPQHREARKVRSLAWKAVQPATVAQAPVPVAAHVSEPPQRFLLWIDGVGGYLICLGQRVTLGQATPDTFVDVPLFADVSRLHASLTRDAEGYLLEGVRAIQVNGRPVERAIVRPNDRITLGACCQLQFRQPSPISVSARLDVTSGHRLPLALDAILLMADTLVLGRGTQVHVDLPELKQPVVLFRHRDGLGVRCGVGMTVNGRQCEGRSLLEPSATVTGADFTFAVEPAGTKLLCRT